MRRTESWSGRAEPKERERSAASGHGRPGPGLLSVVRTRRITPLMRRVTLGGADAARYTEGPNIKLLVPPRNTPVWEWEETGAPASGPSPVKRTFSVRRFDASAGEIDVDFLLHGEGPAARWAQQAEQGDVLGVLGVGGVVCRPARWYLVVGDHCALPAVAKLLPELPEDAEGEVFVDVPGPGEQQELRHPAGMRVHWLHHGRRVEAAGEPAHVRNEGSPGEAGEGLPDAATAVRWPEHDDVFAWVAGESADVRRIRSWLRREHGLTHRQHLVIGYWKRGMAEDVYHDRSDNDRDQDYYRISEEMRRSAA